MLPSPFLLPFPIEKLVGKRVERHDGAITPTIAACFFFFSFFFSRVVAATTNLLTVIFLIMCGNVPILVGSGIGILLHVIRLRSGGYIFVLCAQRLNKLLLLAR